MILVEEFLEIVKFKGVIIVMVESCIGGMVVVVIIDVVGFLVIFDWGFVIYINDVKI